MSVSRMDKFINIKQITFTKDSEAFKERTETSLAANVRACHESRKSSKKWANLAAFETVTDIFSFRKIPNLKITDKLFIEYEEDLYSIFSVTENKMYVEILATKEVGSIG